MRKLCFRIAYPVRKSLVHSKIPPIGGSLLHHEGIHCIPAGEMFVLFGKRDPSTFSEQWPQNGTNGCTPLSKVRS